MNQAAFQYMVKTLPRTFDQHVKIIMDVSARIPRRFVERTVADGTGINE